MYGHIHYYTEKGQVKETFINGTTREMLRETKRHIKRDGLNAIRLIVYKVSKDQTCSIKVAVYGLQEIMNCR